MRGLANRVQRLAEHGGAPVCPVCGANPNAPATFTFGEPTAFPGPPPPDEQCPRCGRVLSFTIRFDSRMNEEA